MADKEHLAILNRGVSCWNEWRKKNPSIQPDLSGLDQKSGAFVDADFKKTNFRDSDLRHSDFSGATLRWANFHGANLYRANFHRADLTGTNFYKTNLRKANLYESTLEQARLIMTNFEGAILSDSRVYGISVWNIITNDKTKQSNLIVTCDDEPAITVDNLEVAQFIYLLLHNEKIRHVIDTITSKVVLILGRFTKERKAVLDAIREELRRSDYLPVLFDFEGPASRDTRETVSTLAHMARFIIADITDARSIPAELECIVPQLPSVPIQPLILDSDYEYGLFEHIKRFPWVLETYRYDNQETLLASLKERVIGPAETKAIELRQGRIM